MKIACLDFEGVLVPEIWVNLAHQTGIDELKVTTRDISDYDELMRYRLDVMQKHKLGYNELNAAAKGLKPLDGAAEFLNWLRQRCQVAIISDTFYELAGPLLEKLEYPMTLCHRLDVSSDGRIRDYFLRQKDPKRHSVKAFQSLNYQVIAAGDSYNDISMLEQAEDGIFFKPARRVVEDYPEYPIANNYTELSEMIVALL
jgi:phosphoserine/homoserine phosphotransferase